MRAAFSAEAHVAREDPGAVSYHGTDCCLSDNQRHTVTPDITLDDPESRLGFARKLRRRTSTRDAARPSRRAVPQANAITSARAADLVGYKAGGLPRRGRSSRPAGIPCTRRIVCATARRRSRRQFTTVADEISSVPQPLCGQQHHLSPHYLPIGNVYHERASRTLAPAAAGHQDRYGTDSSWASRSQPRGQDADRR